MPGEERFRISRGMPVVDQNERPVGNLESIFSENDTGASRFINVGGRLLPVETIDGVEGERIKLAVPQERIREFPEHAAGQMPSVEAQQQAYDAIGLSGPAVDRP